MTDAPKRIWAEPPDIFDGMGFWHVNGDGPGSRYILATPAALSEAPEVQALIAEAVEKATRVRPLVWRDVRDTVFIHAGEINGISYTIMPTMDGQFRVYGVPGAHDNAAQFPTLEAAKAAAQADYEQRIRAAIGGENE